MKVITLGAAFVLIAALQVESGDPLGMRLQPSFVTSAPAILRVLATVETHADNRELEVVAESPSFYRSSTVSLDGDRAPRLNAFVFRNLPDGQYEITATLKGMRGRARAVQSRVFHVVAEAGR